MDLQLLIDAIVRQTTVLIAQLATAGGARTQLSEIANRVFLELVDELHAQGVSRKVSADMFGLALRTYLRRIQRLRESSSERGQSLWEALYAALGEGGLMTRGELLQRFRYDEAEVVTALLQDMCESGLVMRLGKGEGTAYRAATGEELAQLRASQASGAEELLWAVIYREGPWTRDALSQRMGGVDVGPWLDRLVVAGRVTQSGQGATARYATRHFFIPLGQGAGWEAAVFDHYQALVRTITTKLRDDPLAQRTDLIGGSTYEVEVWPGHPLETEVLGELARFRTRMSDLRERVRAHNTAHGRPKDYLAVTIYGGQCVTQESDNEEGSDV